MKKKIFAFALQSRAHSLVSQKDLSVQQISLLEKTWSRPGRLFSEKESEMIPWGWLLYLFGKSLNPTAKQETLAVLALVIELLVVATDIQDDRLDGELDVSEGEAEILEEKIFLIVENLFLSLKQGELYKQHYRQQKAYSLGGQQADLALEEVDIESYSFAKWRFLYRKQASQKAGPFFALTFLFAAIAAEAAPQFVSQLFPIASQFGIAAQLFNDAQDCEAIVHRKSQKTDLQRRKKTLPIIVAAFLYPHLQPSSFWSRFSSWFSSSTQEKCLFPFLYMLPYARATSPCWPTDDEIWMRSYLLASTFSQRLAMKYEVFAMRQLMHLFKTSRYTLLEEASQLLSPCSHRDS